MLAGGHGDSGFPEGTDPHDLPADLSPRALILLQDQIRTDVVKTLDYFRSQGVELKILSGDAPETVAAVARKVGIARSEYYADASRLRTYAQIKKTSRFCNIYGRVSPAQKREMVLALKADGYKVAMIGDGVNDILALKEADCSIALGNGSGAAKNISNIILMNSDFSALPEVVAQGRRVINNIRSAASMFLIKTIFSFLLCLVTIFFGDRYPFQPIQLTLIGAFSVGIPCFILSQEPNHNKVQGSFLREVFRKAIPPAAVITISNCIVLLAESLFFCGSGMAGTACFLVTGWNYMGALRRIYTPLNRFRASVIAAMQLGFFITAVAGERFLFLGPMDFGMIVLSIALMTLSPVIYSTLERALEKVMPETI